MGKEPIRVAITGAAGQIALTPLYFKSRKEMSLVNEIIPTVNPNVAFKDVEAAFFVGSMTRKEGMERKELLSANVKIVKDQGEVLDKSVKKSVKVSIVGNPANTNAYICFKHAPSIPKENFTSMTRLDQNRATANIAGRLGVHVPEVKNVIIWRNHSSTQFPDVRHAIIEKNDGNAIPVYDAVKDDNWLQGGFVKTIQTRGAAVISARKMSSAYIYWQFGFHQKRKSVTMFLAHGKSNQTA